MEDTLAFRSDEGRGYRRNISGSWKQAEIRKYPNEETLILFIESIYNISKEQTQGTETSQYLEEKKANKSDSLSSGERNGEKPKLCIKGSGTNLKNRLMIQLDELCWNT